MAAPVGFGYHGHSETFTYIEAKQIDGFDGTGTIIPDLRQAPNRYYMKENFARAISSGDLDDCLDLEATHHVHCGQTEDHRNATKAFVEKREPVFEGR